MHIVVMGCGRVGSTLAASLGSRGHDVAVVDQTAASFRRLPSEFRGRTVQGVGFDRDVLEAAGIREAAAFAAVSSGDNSNIISARVARETFGVDTVVARIYDPRRAEVYERLGIPTVATVHWTVDQMMQRLVPDESAGPVWQDPTGGVVLAEVLVHRSRLGQGVAALEQQAGARIAFVTRFGRAHPVTASTVLQEGDRVHVVVEPDRYQAVAAALHAPTAR